MLWNMDQCAFSRIMAEETAEALDWIRSYPPAYLGNRPPTTWDINNGFCEDFAEAVAARVPDAEAVPAYDPELHPSREDGGWNLDHFVILWRGRFYDAECHEGVECVKDLPLYRNRGKTRAQVLCQNQPL